MLRAMVESPSLELFKRCVDVTHRAVLGGWLDLVILKVFNLGDSASMIHNEIHVVLYRCF